MSLTLRFDEKTTILDTLKKGRLPDSRGWAFTTDSGFGLAHIAARNELLPADFSEWDLTDDHGLPVAHIAAENCILPKNFMCWEIRDRIGRTVAHVAVQRGPMPPDFNLWTMRDRCGVNVAETACIHRHLPTGITDWRKLVETAGTPVNVVPPPLEIHRRLKELGYGLPPKDFSKLQTMFGVSAETETEEDFRINSGNFLDDFYRYGNNERNYMLLDAPKDMPENWQVPFLGAAAAVLARRFDLDVPAWANEPRCFLPDKSPYYPYRQKWKRKLKAPASTPPEFVERNVFFSGYVLYRV
jgi:hypothetical protein